jgi:hypothetical protein
MGLCVPPTRWFLLHFGFQPFIYPKMLLTQVCRFARNLKRPYVLACAAEMEARPRGEQQMRSPALRVLSNSGLRTVRAECSRTDSRWSQLVTLPPIIVDLMKLLFDMAVPAAACTMMLAGMALRQEGGVNFQASGKFQRWMPLGRSGWLTTAE